MNRDEIRSAVLGALATVAPEADPATLEPNADLRDALDIDSMDFLNFVTALHAKVGVDIPERDYPQVRTLEGCVEYVSSKLAA